MAGSIEQILRNQDYYEIRLESIGGLCANLCGKMMGELAVRYLNLNSAGFSSYGSEKTGTPVKGHIRFCPPEKEIRVHSPVVTPDLLVIFHQALTRDEGVWRGCSDRTSVIIALDQGQEENVVRNLPSVVGCCYVVDARHIAMETKSRINVVMLGAMVRVMGLAELESARQICRDSLGRKYPAALEGNLRGLEQGYGQVRRLAEGTSGAFRTGDGSDGRRADSGGEKTVRSESRTSGKGQEWGYATAPAGGVNPRFGSTVTAHLSPSVQDIFLFLSRRDASTAGFVIPPALTWCSSLQKACTGTGR